jgi:hypothetical protein
MNNNNDVATDVDAFSVLFTGLVLSIFFGFVAFARADFTWS